jgi:prepilin-type N-terminal cleavage/methylation domain-containing protein
VLRRLRTGEAGFTLIELLVGLSVSLIVSSAALDLIPIADSSARGSLTRQAATVAAQTALERITREARASTAAAVQSPSLLDLNVPLRQPGGGLSTPQHVRYDCSGGHCVRTLCSGAVSGSLVGVGCTPAAPGSELVTGLADANVFAGVLGGSAAPAPVGISPGTRSMDQLQITLRIAMAGHAPLEIDDGTSFANYSL